MKFLNILYTRLTFYFIHKNGYETAKAKNKAFYKTTLLVGIFFFFIYMMIMNSLNQLFWNLDHTRTNAVFFVAPFVLLAYALVEWKLKRHLKILEDVSVYDAEKLKAYNRFQTKIGIWPEFMVLPCFLWFALPISISSKSQFKPNENQSFGPFRLYPVFMFFL